RDLGIPLNHTRLVAYGLDQHMRPEARAVLANAPAFALQLAVPGGIVQALLGEPGILVFLIVEQSEASSDDFFRRIAFDALRPDVPARDDTFRVYHVDGVVRYTLHQKSELLFAAAQCIFRALALGQIAGDLRKTHQLAIRIDYGIDDDMSPERCAVLAHTPAFG